ncbi:hypothetical protein BC332_27097 [Capsicum chinense]|nr:hypothetical protein BC332_27097 [Capsicum chinense]
MAYAALSSLMHTLQKLLQYSKSSLICGTSILQQHFESVYQSLCALQVFLEDTTNEVNDIENLKLLEKKIRDVVYKAEDRIDSSFRRIITLADRHKRERACKSFNDELQKVEKELESLKIGVMQIEFSKYGSKSAEATTYSSSSRKYSTEQNTFVGMKDEFNTILDRLTDQTNDLTVISLVGMGGIGKTTLARKVYDNPSIRGRFDKLAWVTISEDWDQMRRIFPNDNNKSRILLTTRLNYVADYASPDSPPHGMSFLSLDDSWNLFTGRLFKTDPCPPQLIKIGKHIIQQCRGLPLSIVVIAGLLCKMDPTHSNWKKVEENMNSFFGTVSEQCQSILSLSYSYLPQHLKACFLYVVGFPEDIEISVSKLIKLWIAELFVKGRSNKRLEVVAEEYLDELIDRSLILAGTRKPAGRMKTCKIHDLLRQLCIREAQFENFMHVLNDNDYTFSEGINIYPRRVMLSLGTHWKHLYVPKHWSGITTNTIHSLIFTGNSFQVYLMPQFVSQFKLLKVLDVFSINSNFSWVISKLVHLRYVAANIDGAPSLAKLWNLQTLILRRLQHMGVKLLQYSKSSLICGTSILQQHFESVYQSLCALQVFLEDTTNEVNDIENLKLLEKKIRDVVYKAEDRIDSSFRRIITLADRHKRERACKSFNDELQKVEKELESLKIGVMQIEFSKYGSKSAEATTYSSSSRKYSTEQNTFVGMKDEFNTILDRLTDQTNDLTVISLVGMGGIGKTTLARKVYDNPSIRGRFDKLAWVTISEV